MRWNGFRMCIGIAPKFWYDLADEYGLILQNEWPMWQVRGWNEQMDKEYTDWIWQDGSHPSIVIWDAMNEVMGCSLPVPRKRGRIYYGDGRATLLPVSYRMVVD